MTTLGALAHLIAPAAPAAPGRVVTPAMGGRPGRMPVDGNLAARRCACSCPAA